MELIPRQEYLKVLEDFNQKGIIKVITGVRRCGKSTLLVLFKNKLREKGLAEDQFVDINFEEYENQKLTDPNVLHNYLTSKLIKGRMVYFFLDEIQHVYEFQKVVASLFVKPNVDIYITGSNTSLLSSNSATLLSGRYIEIKMLPLSFKEFVLGKGGSVSFSKLYYSYISGTSFPYALQLTGQSQIRTYLEGVYNTVIVKDILQQGKLFEIDKLELLCEFLFDSIGREVSALKIANTLSSNYRRKYDSKTVDRYLVAIKNSYLFYEAKKFNIKGRQLLSRQPKYYAVDVGLRQNLLGTLSLDVGHILENVIYLELLRKGYKVFIGKNNEMEVDFVAIEPNQRKYFQVCASVRDPKTLERELRSLKSIQDNYPKIILTLDEDPSRQHDGIIIQNALEWLVGNTNAL